MLKTLKKVTSELNAVPLEARVFKYADITLDSKKLFSGTLHFLIPFSIIARSHMCVYIIITVKIEFFELQLLFENYARYNRFPLLGILQQ